MAVTPSASERLWRRNLALIALLLAAWLALGFVPAYFARDLDFTLFGWPFSFWMAAYGASLGYLVLIAIYAFARNRAERLPGRRDD